MQLPTQRNQRTTFRTHSGSVCSCLQLPTPEIYAASPNPDGNSHNKHFVNLCETICRCFTTLPSTLTGTTLKHFSALFWLGGAVSLLLIFVLFSFLRASSSPNTALTKSFSTKKEERSTKTHVGIMKNTAWHPRMFSNRR